MRVVRRNILVLLAAFLVVGLYGNVRADLRVVTDVSQSGSTDGTYNSFRASDIAGSAADRTLAWFDLDTTNVSTWDSLDHSLSLYVNVYSDSRMIDRIGSAFASGTVRQIDNPLLGGASADASAQEYFDLVAESIHWSVQLDGASVFGSFLSRAYGEQPADGWDVVIGEGSLASVDGSFSSKDSGPRGGLTYDRTQRLDDGADQVYWQTDIMLKMESAAVPLPGSAIMALFGFAGLAIRQRFFTCNTVAP